MYMTTELDLDINNYNICDVEKLFSFKPKSTYYSTDVELREYEIRHKLLSSGHVNKKIKSDIIAFLTVAKQWLIDVNCKKHDLPSSVPKNWRLDPDEYPKSKEPTSKEENIIEKPQTPFIYTKNSDFFSGTLNPIEKRIVTKIVCIDTVFRPFIKHSQSPSTDFIYTLPDSINNVVSMQLIAAEIPNMAYTFSTLDNNNCFIINLNNICNTNENGNVVNSTFVNYTFTINIPDGNYSSTAFIKTINNIFFNMTTDDNGQNTIALRFLRVDISPTSTCTIIRANNEFMDIPGVPCPYDSTSIYYSPNFNFIINFDVLHSQTRPLYKNLGWMLGFKKANYNINSSNTCISYADSPTSLIHYEGYLKSESSYGSAIDNYLFVEIDDYHNNFPTDTIVAMNSPTASYLGKNIMARITLTTGANTIVNDNASDKIFKMREYFGPVKLEKMQIRLLNRYGDVINLIQNDYSLVLEIKQLYAS